MSQVRYKAQQIVYLDYKVNIFGLHLLILFNYSAEAKGHP